MTSSDHEERTAASTLDRILGDFLAEEVTVWFQGQALPVVGRVVGVGDGVVEIEDATQTDVGTLVIPLGAVSAIRHSGPPHLLD